MSQERLSEMSEAAFEALLDAHIERTAAGEAELPPGVFVDVLLERIEQGAAAPVRLTIDVSGDQLVIMPDRESIDVVVQGNEVLVAGRRLVLQINRR
jgi:hypothetical protein